MKHLIGHEIHTFMIDSLFSCYPYGTIQTVLQHQYYSDDTKTSSALVWLCLLLGMPGQQNGFIKVLSRSTAKSLSDRGQGTRDGGGSSSG